MAGYFGNITRLGRFLYPSLFWKIPTDKKILYLTFDDGPVPEITPWVLSLLKDFDSKATFFCIGENVQKNPKIFRRIMAEGHSIGNHTNNHLNGWKTTSEEYISNTLIAENAITGYKKKNSQPKLFRPPYGRISPKQVKILQKRGFKIVMWDVLSGDFDMGVNNNTCYNNVIHHTGPGSIIVFHDSQKAFPNLKETLPRVMEFFKQKGYSFESLDVFF